MYDSRFTERRHGAWWLFERIIAPTALSTPARYAVALALVALALAVRLWIAPPAAGLPFITFFPAAATQSVSLELS